MAYTTIDDPSAYFQTKIYTGNGTAGTAYTFDGNSDMQPDFIWGSQRDEDGGARFVFDSSRGTTARLKTDADTEEQTRSGVTAFNSDGFTMGDHADSNNNSETHVVWAWKCNGGTTETAVNESGDNPANVRQTNTTAGFSIITSTGTGATGTIAHGLGAVPEIIISKQRSNAENWAIYHGSNTSAPETEILTLNTTDATADNANAYNDTAPTSSVFTVHTKNEVNTDARTYVHYVFAPIQGYSKFGGYTGNGNQDGTFVYTGFKPAWIMIKRTDASKNWYIADSKRSPINVNKAHLVANDTDAEDTSGDATDSYFDILSNGFKLRQDFSHLNADGGTFVYIAFAEHPFVSSEGVPTTAR